MDDEKINFYVKHMKKVNPEYQGLQFDRVRMKWCTDIKETKTKEKKKASLKEMKRRELIKIRDIVFDRDDYSCSNCGSTEGLQVHHVQALADGGENVSNNLVTLCSRCHADEHRGQNVHRIMVVNL